MLKSRTFAAEIQDTPSIPINLISMNKKLLVMMMMGLSMMTVQANETDELVDSSKVVDLDEVVVVAQPKEQVRLRLQPVSSSVFGSEQLQQLNVRDLSQLSQYARCGRLL